MALKVLSSVKNEREELIPTSQVNDILNLNSKDENYEDLEYHDDVDLGLCLEYFDKNYECYCLEPNMMVQWKTMFITEILIIFL